VAIILKFSEQIMGENLNSNDPMIFTKNLASKGS